MLGAVTIAVVALYGRLRVSHKPPLEPPGQRRGGSARDAGEKHRMNAWWDGRGYWRFERGPRAGGAPSGRPRSFGGR
jgi:hypothetical protein